MNDDLLEQLKHLSSEDRELLKLLLTEGDFPPADTPIPSQSSEPRVFPQSYAQQRIWFLYQLDPQSAVYNVPSAYRLTGPLDIIALERSLRALVARHASLRTVFTVHDGMPQQIIREDPQFSLAVIDLTHLAPKKREPAALEQITAESEKPFDLTQDLMMRALLLKLGVEAYVLSIVMHHIASDGWSASIFRRELAELYAAYCSGGKPNLAPLPMQYGDYTVWQRDWLQGQRLKRQLGYWRKQLTGVMPLELPVARPRPAIQSNRGDTHRFVLPEDLVGRLRALSQHTRTTLFMTLLAAFSTLLYRYSEQDDMAIGTVVANRRRTEFESLIGFFLNTLVLRSDLSGDPAFSELLVRVRRTTLDAYEHQDIPFEILLEELQPERTMSRTPLFQVLIVLQNMPSAEMELVGLEIESLKVGHKLSKLDLSLYLKETDGGLQARFEYSTDLFDSSTIERLSTHFQVLLESIVSNPQRPISQLAIMPSAERTLVLETWNQTGTDISSLPDLVSQFYIQVAAQSDKAAFLDGTDSLIYRDLNERSNRLAHYLLAQGIAPGTRLGLCLERALSVPVALLAIFKVGGVYVPLDPRYPAERLRFMLDDAGVTAVITESQWHPLLAIPEAENADRVIFYLDKLHSTLAEQSIGDVHTPLAPDNTAYIIYTSGSTGWPKGVAVPHRQILNRLAWMWERYPFEPGEVGCQKTALSFVDSLWELLGYVLQGVPTVIISDEDVRDVHQLVDILAAHHVSRLWMVPSLLRVILESYPNLQTRLPSLRFWVSSGEALTTALYRQFEQSMPRAKLYNLYGTSELWDVTWFDPDEPGVSWHGNTVPIGRPIDNMRTVILDPNGCPLPIGIPGELCVGGVGLAEGYINQPDLNAKKFNIPAWIDPNDALPDVASSVWSSSDRIYHSGDFARWLPDGNVEYMGRADYQVKLHGHRIELEEIEAQLERHPAIHQAVAAVSEPGSKDEHLVAYCLPYPGQKPDTAELSRFLKTYLPSSMIPSSFLLLDALPLTPSGKINRRALAEVETVMAPLGGEYVSPRTLTEQKLVSIWASLLGREDVSIYDNFFQVGGHSLLGIQLIARIEDQFGQRLPLALLFSAPTVAELASYLEQPAAAERSPTLIPIQEGGERTPFFCVHGFGGGVLGYADLARLLGSNQPFYGLQAAGLTGDEDVDESIERMASRYVAAMREVQPSGPYLIGGYCFGGVVAFEMARQLEAVGDSVPLVAIMEGYAPRRYQRKEPLVSLRRWRTVWQSIPYWLADYWSLGFEGVRWRVKHRGRVWHKRFQQLLGTDVYLDAQDILPDDLSAMPEHYRQLMEKHLLALRRYAPEPMQGGVTLFVARGKTINTAVFGSEDPEHGWGILARGGVEIELVDGGHRNIHLQPHVGSLAAALTEKLRSVTADDRPRSSFGT